MKQLNRRTFISGTLAGILLLATAQVSAMTLQEAKAAGLIGERSTGYLGVVTPNAEASQIVDSINAQRRAEYQAIAQRNGTSLEAVEALAGQTAINKTPAGQYIDTGSGWQVR